MITTVLSKIPSGKVYVLGLEKSDLEAIAKDGILTVEIVGAKVAIHIVKGTKEEYLDSIKKEFPSSV